MNKTIFLTGIAFGVLAIMLGAFGAHGLERLIDTSSVQTFETGVKYQMYHALLLLILANITSVTEESKKWIYYVLVSGILLFSFSIYLLAINDLTTFDFKAIGFITPIGGLLLISGWIILGFNHIKLSE